MGELTGLVNPSSARKGLAPGLRHRRRCGQHIRRNHAFGMVARSRHTIPSLTNFTAGYTYSDDCDPGVR